MKTINILSIFILFVLLSCSSGGKINAQKVSFGIYETVKVIEIPNSIIEKLKTSNIQFEKNVQLPIIGYLTKTDTLQMNVDLSKENIKIVKTFYSVDKEGKYLAVVAVKQNPEIIISDIYETVCKGQNIEIHFSSLGAKKWAEMTRNNIGKMVAFTIDNQIYTMPAVHSEIKSGVALINGLESESIAKKLSDLLNAGIKQ